MRKNARKERLAARPAAAKKKLSGKWLRSAGALVKQKAKGLKLSGANGGRDPETQVSEPAQ